MSLSSILERIGHRVSFNGGWFINGTQVTADASELNLVDGSVAGTAVASKAAVLGTNKNLDEFHTAALYLGAAAGTLVTPTAAEINRLAGVTGTPLVAKRIIFSETAGAGVYTGSVTVPANAMLVDIIVHATSLWTATTSATLIVGDTDDDGYYAAVDLKATDLLADESLSFAQAGGKGGVYLTATHALKRRDPSDRTITAKVTTVGAAGNGGATQVIVIWAHPVSADTISATKA